MLAPRALPWCRAPRGFRHRTTWRAIRASPIRERVVKARDLWARGRVLARHILPDAPAPENGVSARLSVTPMIFSKDRAMQLEACLTSISTFAPYALEDIVVIFRATSPQFAEAYGTLVERHGVRLRPESDDFRRDVMEALDRANEHVVFHTDDDVFFAAPPAAPSLPPGFAAFSLRLGLNTTYCYPTGSRQDLPSRLDRGDVFAWDWTRADGDFAYPMSLNGHVFSRRLLGRMLARSRFANPNELEIELHVRRHLAPRWMLAFRQSCVVSIPANIVTSTHVNRAAGTPGLTSEALNSRFLAGQRIDVGAMDFSSVQAAHQEIPFVFAGGAARG